jgi:hypothetical protein
MHAEIGVIHILQQSFKSDVQPHVIEDEARKLLDVLLQLNCLPGKAPKCYGKDMRRKANSFLWSASMSNLIWQCTKSGGLLELDHLPTETNRTPFFF